MTTSTLHPVLQRAFELGILNQAAIQQIMALQQTNPDAFAQLLESAYQKIIAHPWQNAPIAPTTPQYSTRIAPTPTPAIPGTPPGVGAPPSPGGQIGGVAQEPLFPGSTSIVARPDPTTPIASGNRRISRKGDVIGGGGTAITSKTGSFGRILAKLNRGEDLTPDEEKWIDDLPDWDERLGLLQTAGQAGLAYKQKGAEFTYKQGQDKESRQQAIEERRSQLQQQLISQLLSNPASFQALAALGGQTPANAIPGFRIPQTPGGTSAYGAIQRGIQGQGSAEEIGQGLTGLAGNPINPSSFYFDSSGDPLQGGIPTFANFNRLQPGQQNILNAATGFSGAQQGLTEQMASVTPTLARRQRSIIPAGAGGRLR